MAFKFKNRVKEGSTDTGTGDLQLSGTAADGFQKLVDALSNGDTFPYSIEYTSKSDGTAWENGIATFTTGTPNKISRTLVIASSTGSAISWGAAAKTISLAPIADTSGLLVFGYPPALSSCFRLTTETGVSVSTSDRTAQSTVYLTPHNGSLIWLYDTTAGIWFQRSTAEISLALSGLTSGKPYDVFAYWTGSAVAIEFLVWTNGTTRATALVRQDGVWCKTGALDRRYVGTFYTTGTTTTEDSAKRRFVWSADNRVRRHLDCTSTTTRWNYTTNTWREAEGGSTDGTSRFAFVRGLNEDVVEALNVSAAYNASVPCFVEAAVALDGAAVGHHPGGHLAVASMITPLPPALYTGYPSAGYHYLARFERSSATGTTQWFGSDATNDPDTTQASGMFGWVWG